MITKIERRELSYYMINDISKVLWRITGDGCDFVSPAQMTYRWIVPLTIEMNEGLKEVMK